MTFEDIIRSIMAAGSANQPYADQITHAQRLRQAGVDPNRVPSTTLPAGVVQSAMQTMNPAPEQRGLQSRGGEGESGGRDFTPGPPPNPAQDMHRGYRALSDVLLAPPSDTREAVGAVGQEFLQSQATNQPYQYQTDATPAQRMAAEFLFDPVDRLTPVLGLFPAFRRALAKGPRAVQGVPGGLSNAPGNLPSRQMKMTQAHVDNLRSTFDTDEPIKLPSGDEMEVGQALDFAKGMSTQDYLLWLDQAGFPQQFVDDVERQMLIPSVQPGTARPTGGTAVVDPDLADPTARKFSAGKFGELGFGTNIPEHRQDIFRMGPLNSEAIADRLVAPDVASRAWDNLNNGISNGIYPELESLLDVAPASLDDIVNDATLYGRDAFAGYYQLVDDVALRAEDVDEAANTVLDSVGRWQSIAEQTKGRVPDLPISAEQLTETLQEGGVRQGYDVLRSLGVEEDLARQTIADVTGVDPRPLDATARVVIHRTRAYFDRFDTSRTGVQTSARTHGDVIFFSENPSDAHMSAASTIGQSETGAQSRLAYLDIRNPFYHGAPIPDAIWDDVGPIFERAGFTREDVNRNFNMERTWGRDNGYILLRNVMFEGYDPTDVMSTAGMKRASTKNRENLVAEYEAAKKLNQYIESKGFDGMMHWSNEGDGGPVWMAFNADQVYNFDDLDRAIELAVERGELVPGTPEHDQIIQVAERRRQNRPLTEMAEQNPFGSAPIEFNFGTKTAQDLTDALSAQLGSGGIPAGLVDELRQAKDSHTASLILSKHMKNSPENAEIMITGLLQDLGIQAPAISMGWGPEDTAAALAHNLPAFGQLDTAKQMSLTNEVTTATDPAHIHAILMSETGSSAEDVNSFVDSLVMAMEGSIDDGSLLPTMGDPQVESVLQALGFGSAPPPGP